MPHAKPNILDLSQAELEDFITKKLDEPPFRARQVWQWLWQKGVRSFDQMTNVTKALRMRLAERTEIRLPEIARESVSRDGTIKLILHLDDGELVETVLIPSESQSGQTRMTQCLSSQVGCAMGCTFCSTGSMGFTRNMTPGEIAGQIQVGRTRLGDRNGDILKNIVFMGMGEPLMNFENLMKSLETISSETGLNYSRRRITVSTCGVKKGLRELGESGKAFLAISLHATDQDTRKRIMPAAAHWPLDELLDSLAEYPTAARERITFEYLLLGGVNHSLDNARELARITRSLGAKINLIVYNQAEGSVYRAPNEDEILAFEHELWRLGVTAILRKSKGQDIHAACGQLKAEAIKE